MPKVKLDGLTLNYEQQGSGEPLLLIPYLAADHACYAFQVEEYAKHFTCISIDLRGTGESDAPDGPWSMELFADDVVRLMQALGVRRAHLTGLSFGAAVAMWIAVKHPDMVKTLSLHAAWTRTDPFLRNVVEGWQALASGLGRVAETVILGIFPWCLTPELYAAKPDYVRSLADFVRSRPPQPVSAFLRQSNAVLAHDIESQVGKITAPTQVTCGRRDLLTSTRFAEPIQRAIRGAELLVFEECAHAPIYERVEEFNTKTLAFLRRHAG
jgi:aminoacrylate hydrolase